MILKAGDIAFFGNGPNNEVWYIGIEYKNLEDICGCIKSGRFTGTQLPGMMRLYDVSFLLIEGIGLLDYHTGQFSKRLGKMTFGFGLQYSSYENFLTSVSVNSALAGKPCIVKRSTNIQETLHIIRDIQAWFGKPWDMHKSISRPDMTKLQRTAYELEVVKVNPDDPEYPKYLLRKAVFQVMGIGWDVAGKIADTFNTVENALKATVKDWQAIERIGPGLAKRVYRSLHGYDDPSIAQKVKKARKTYEVCIL